MQNLTQNFTQPAYGVLSAQATWLYFSKVTPVVIMKMCITFEKEEKSLEPFLWLRVLSYSSARLILKGWVELQLSARSGAKKIFGVLWLPCPSKSEKSGHQVSSVGIFMTANKYFLQITSLVIGNSINSCLIFHMTVHCLRYDRNLISLVVTNETTYELQNE